MLVPVLSIQYTQMLQHKAAFKKEAAGKKK
jgi:hypothetical protein